MAKRDFYDVLGVSKSAGADEIKKAYRKTAIKYHPDKNPGDKAAEDKFREATEAYEVLSDPKRRSQYDTFGFAGEQMQGGGRNPFDGAGGFDFSDVFGDVFSGFFNSGSSGGFRGQDLQYNLEVTFEQAAFGHSLEIEIPKSENCSSCGGSGAFSSNDIQACRTCGGQGKVKTDRGFFSVTTTCPTCQGQGRVIRKACTKCGGSGQAQVRKRIKVNIPAGINHGQKIKKSGEGEAAPGGGQPGDLYVLIYIKDHPIFTRNDYDVLCTVPISFPKAALGGDIDVPTLTGKVKLSIPPGTQSNRTFRLKNQGIQHLGHTKRGNMLVKVNIETPTNLTKEQTALLEQLDKSLSESQSPIFKSFFEKVKNLF